MTATLHSARLHEQAQGGPYYQATGIPDQYLQRLLIAAEIAPVLPTPDPTAKPAAEAEAGSGSEWLRAAAVYKNRLGSLAVDGFPILAEALPGLRIIKDHIDEDTDISPDELTGHMSALRALAPVAKRALDIAPHLSPHGHETSKGLRSATSLARKVRAGNAVASLFQAASFADSVGASLTARWLNSHRDLARTKLTETYDTYVGPVNRLFDELVERFGRPQEKLRKEVRALTDKVWLDAYQRAGDGNMPSSQDVGDALFAVLSSVGHDKELWEARLPLLARLGLGKLPALQPTIAIDANGIVRKGIDAEGVERSKHYDVVDRRGKKHRKVDIATSDALGTVAAEIMHALESVAGPDQYAAARINHLRYYAHPLRDLIRTGEFVAGLEAKIASMSGLPYLLDAASHLLPEDARDAERVKAALRDSLLPKPRPQR